MYILHYMLIEPIIWLFLKGKTLKSTPESYFTFHADAHEILLLWSIYKILQNSKCWIKHPSNNSHSLTQNVQEASTSRHKKIMGLKKASHRQTETAEPLRNSPPETTSKRTISNTAPQGAAELQCPLCFIRFDDEHTTEYLKHCEECAKLWVSHLTDFTQKAQKALRTQSLQAHMGLLGGATGCWWRHPLDGKCFMGRSRRKSFFLFVLLFDRELNKVVCGLGLKIWLWVGCAWSKGLLTSLSLNADGLVMKSSSVLSICGL